VRSFAAALALIGLAFEQTGIADEADVRVSLTPQQVAASLFAVEARLAFRLVAARRRFTGARSGGA
jgi:hypothetical protein